MLDKLKENNRAWAEGKLAEDPRFFARLEAGQSPEYMWIGCSDSRVPAGEIIGLDSGELFVHRNVANLATQQDPNYFSVLQYAVNALKVKHIIVAGHYGCGGVAGAVSGMDAAKAARWLNPIREVYRDHRAELAAIGSEDARLERLCELNVIRQVRNVATDYIVQEAWARDQDLMVHGWIYSLANGLITDLDVSVGSPEDVERLL
jgi:carbonic anhydrase